MPYTPIGQATLLHGHRKQCDTDTTARLRKSERDVLEQIRRLAGCEVFYFWRSQEAERDREDAMMDAQIYVVFAKKKGITMKQKHIGLAVLAVVFVLVFGLSAQAASTHAQKHSPDPTVIEVNGAEHPELIDDLTAYRLVLNMISAKDQSEEEIARQTRKLDPVGLSKSDRLLTLIILASFRSRFDAFVNNLHEAVMAAKARHEPPLDTNPLLQQLDDLVRSSIGDLKRSLSAEGFLRFDSYVQTQKRSMKLYTTEKERK